MILFTTHQCSRCREIREVFILESLNIKEIILTSENAEALAELAWYGLVDQARQSLPILVCDDGRVVTDIEEIVSILSQRAKEVLIKRLTGKDEVEPSMVHSEQDTKASSITCQDGSCSLNI